MKENEAKTRMTSGKLGTMSTKTTVLPLGLESTAEPTRAKQPHNLLQNPRQAGDSVRTMFQTPRCPVASSSSLSHTHTHSQDTLWRAQAVLH